MRLLAPAAAAVLLLALTGCSEPESGSPMPTGAAPVTSAQPSDEPSPAASPTEPGATAEPAETSAPAPTLPPEATTNDAAGAEAFVRYWYELANHALLTGDVEALRVVSDEGCLTCQRLIEIVERQYSTGGTFQGGQSVLSEVTAPRPDADGYVIAAFVLEQEPPLAVDAQGTVVNPGEPDRAESYLQMSMLWEVSGWRALEIAQ